MSTTKRKPSKRRAGAGPVSRPSSGAHVTLRRVTPWIAGTLLLVITGVALYAFTGAAASEPSRSQPASAADISYGPEDAPVVVMEYSDFECPFCAEYAAIMAQLREEYGDRVRFVFRFFPLENHRYAMISSQAAYAAHLQGRFWEMHDLLFAGQDEWVSSPDPRPYFDAYAESLGLDMARFRTDIDAPSTIDAVRAQRAEGDAAGVTHTPWFVIGDEVVLPRTVDDFSRLIEAEL